MQVYLFRDDQQHGPYEIEHVRGWLNEGVVTVDDQVWSEERPEWRPLGELLSASTFDMSPPALPQQNTRIITIDSVASPVASAISNFLTDDQDQASVQKIVARTQELLTTGESIDYIAVQKKPVVTISPEAIVLTNKRFMIVRLKLLGMTFEDHPWREIANVHMSEQMLGATITCLVVGGKTLAIDSLPKKQARRIYTYAQEMEEQMHDLRRHRELESKRAGAMGVVVNSTAAMPPQLPQQIQPALPSSASSEPMQVLGKLKQLLDAGLIEQAEYEAKKTEVLARL